MKINQEHFSSTMISLSAMKWKLPKDLHDIPNFDPQSARLYVRID